MPKSAARRHVRFVPRRQEWPRAGTYQLGVHTVKPTAIMIGRRGTWRLPRGEYVYTGRASRGLLSRIMRYVQIADSQASDQARPLRWHIDYILASPAVRLVCVVLCSADPADECRVNQATGGDIVVPRCGASDCRAGCGAHFKRVPRGYLSRCESVVAVGPSRPV